MRKMGFLCIIIVLMIYASGWTQNSDFGIKFSGYVKTDLMIDSRQNVAAREGHFLLYPSAENLDADNEDINAQPNLNILAIQTRLTGKITGPDAFGAKTSGTIEGAFFGHSNSDVNGFRLRHAFVKLDWEKNSLMIGQYWHPMFVTDVYAGTISFTTGAPFQPFTRNPQIRWIKTSDQFSIFVAAIAQRDFTSTGPSGGGSIYLRNAVIPNLHVQAKYKTDNMVIGAGLDWKSLKPRLSTSMNYKSDETVSGISLIGFAKTKVNDVTLKLEGVYGENLTDHLMIGGYGVTAIDARTGIETYAPTKLYSVWGEISTGKTVELGLFGGFCKNLGADDNLLNFWGRSQNIDALYRLAPRVVWKSGITRLAAEVEYTGAAYGSVGEKSKVENAEYVNNLRLLLAAYYFF